MPPSDRRSPRKSAVLWGIAALACVAIFVCWQTVRRRAADEGPPANGAMFELVNIGYDLQQLPERFRFISYYRDDNRKGHRGHSVLISVVGHRGLHRLWLG